MRKELLYSNQNPSTIPSSIVLSEEFSNFDVLSFVCCDSNNTNVRYTLLVSVEAINDALSSETSVYLRTTNAIYYGWNFIPNSTTKFTKSSGNTVSPVFVYGISM